VDGSVISWVVASHDPAVLAVNLQPALDEAAAAGDEVIVVRDAASIAEAYNAGSTDAAHPLRCFVHHDVRVRDLDALRGALLAACRPDVGLVGVIGSRVPALPWWDAPQRCGSVIDSRMGLLDFSPGDCAAAVLDGLLLATAQPLTWDESYAGWHGYDHDASMQMLARDLPNWCLPYGSALVEHNTAGPASTDAIDGWDAARERFREKWVTHA
jgi:hypothetical protein